MHNILQELNIKIADTLLSTNNSKIIISKESIKRKINNIYIESIQKFSYNTCRDIREILNIINLIGSMDILDNKLIN